jgi:hypothetical protein
MPTIIEEPSIQMHPQQNNPSTPDTSQRPRRIVAKYDNQQSQRNYTTQDDNKETCQRYANSMHQCKQPVRLQCPKKPCNISTQVIKMFLFNAISDGVSTKQIKLEQIACSIVHPITKETITKYDKLANDPITRDVWRKALYKELGRLA